MLEVALVVEDVLSLAVMEKILAHAKRNYIVKIRLVEHGFGNIRKSTLKYKNASNVLPHIILTDLDQALCPVSLLKSWGVDALPETMLFRIAVREVEAWLLADREGFSSFVAIPLVKIPQFPESLTDPKQSLLSLIRKSRNKRFVAELVPAHGSKVSIGPLYNERLSTFVRDVWSVDSAKELSPSLNRTVKRLSNFLI